MAEDNEQSVEGRIREKEQVRRSRRVTEKRLMDDNIDQEARDRAEDAMQASISHEILCNERWKNQALSMARLETLMTKVETAVNERVGKIPATIIATLCTIVGWLAARAFPHV